MGTNRSHVLSVCAAVAIGAVVLLAPGIASAAEAPFDDNAECLECHSVDLSGAAFTKADFSEPAVDRATACARCHWQSVHPIHNPLSQCQQCHHGMPWRRDLYAVDVTTPYGYFASAASAASDAGKLHGVHVNGSWPQTIAERPFYGGAANCVSCHAPVACEACHAPGTGHGTHSDSLYPPVARRVTTGLEPGDTTADTTFEYTRSCTKAECHDTAAAARAPADDIVDDAFGFYSGTWWSSSDYGLYRYTFHETNAPGAYAVFTVSGEGVLRVLGDKSAGGGAISVSVDGGPLAYVSCYDAVQWRGVVLYEVAVGPGTHTVNITAETDPATGYSLVSLDAVGVFGDAAPSGAFVPTCASCHAERTATHGYDTVDHVADVSADLESGTACGACHAMDLATEHGKPSSSSSGAGCATCHPSPRDTFTVWGDTCSQAGCHAVRHAARATAHDASAVGAGCGGSGCHGVSDVAAVHADSVPSNAMRPSCVTCHSAPGTLPATLDCAAAGCHSSVVGHRAAHQTASSAECVACHEYANVQDQHAPSAIGATVGGAVNDGCNICHGGGGWTNVRAGNTRECVSCHNADEVGGHDYAPTDPNHYPAASHAASMPACAGCHSADLRTEHAKVTVGVSCVTCHEGRVDYFPGPWDKACETDLCHATKHVGAQLKHRSTRSECAGTGCHAVTDADDIHASAPAGCNTCHVSAAQPATTVDCLSSGCHYGATGDHTAAHEAAALIGPGCEGCHFTNLTEEHAKLGYTCATCHDSVNASVVAAISYGTAACSSCHPAVNGRDRHAAQNEVEFTSTSVSGHNAVDGLSFMDSTFVVRGATYTMSLPAASSFLRAGWTTASRVTCDDCHTFGSSPGGPHGAAVTVTIDPAYPYDYSRAILSQSSPGMTSNVICAKCHNLYNGGSYSNVVHKEHDDRGLSEGGRCVSCHVSIPHAWRRPRMLGSVNDPAPYATVAGGVYEIALKNYSPGSWQKSDCYAGCSSERHPNQSNPWPALAFGGLAGTVTDASGAPLAGAWVKAGVLATVTTAADGTWSIANAETGSYSVSAGKAAYTAATKSVTVEANKVATLAFSLSLAPTTATLTGTVRDGTGALSGATVSVAGGGAAVTGPDGRYTITGAAAGVASVTYSAAGHTTQTVSVTLSAGSTTTKDITLAVVAATNIAPGSTASASSQRSGYDAAKAIDGSTSTRWFSNGGGTQWLRVDLGTERQVEKVVIPWYSSYYAKAYRVQVSTDGSSWTDVYSTSYSSLGTKTHSFTACSARYVRIYCTSASSSSGYSVTEFQVWGR